MGGSAFAISRPGEVAVDIQRLPNATYLALANTYVGHLYKFYNRVAIPPSAPEKDSHGDVDILVSEARHQFTVEDLAIALYARRYNHIPRDPTTNFAIPISDPSGNDDRPTGDDEGAIPCHQLDVHVCPAESFDWEVFKKSWGDLWSFLGTSIRPFGLTANQTGLYVRIPQIELQSAKKSLLLLTKSPEETLAFLGLDRKTYDNGFASVEQLFEFVMSGRFFRRTSYITTELKTSDRKRLEKRPLYRRFVEEYLAARPDVSSDNEVPSGDDKQVDGEKVDTRESVLEEALEHFGVQSQYQSMMEVWESKRQVDDMWVKVASTLPLEGDRLNLCIRALKRWAVLDANSGLSVRNEACLDKSGGLEALMKKENGTKQLTDWVRGIWADVVKKEKDRVGEAKRKRKASSDHLGPAQ